MGYENPWAVFFWHLLSAMGLILAWIHIAGLFIKNKVIRWLCIACLLIIGFHTSTGSNELYYNEFVPSLPAKALASWALYGWLRNKYFHWIILLIAATYIQPLVGLQLFLGTTLASGVEYYRSSPKISFPWKQCLLYVIFILPWIYLLAINNGGHEDPAFFMDVMEFRLSHHFFGSYFGSIHLIILLLLGTISMIFYKEKLKWMFMWLLAGCIVYAIGVELLRSPVILYSQWWKTTIWIEAFAFIAIFATTEKKFSFLNKFEKFGLLLPILFLLFISTYRLSGITGAPPLIMEPFAATKSDEVDISEQAFRLAGENSVFLTPT